MRAIVCRRYGSFDVLHLEEVPTPVPSSREIQIRIRATSVTAAGLGFVSGRPLIGRVVAPWLGWRRPKNPILGVELSGEITKVGHEVTRFSVGDRVIAEPEVGAFAEYICMPEDGLIAPKPERVSHEEAAAACDGMLTALPFLRDGANLQGGQRVLINGASSSIGTFAIQLAKHLGAEVTGVCSTANLELARSLGADHVIDYTQVDFTRSEKTYDVVFDVVAKSSFSRCKHILADGGIYLCTFPTLDALLPRMGSKKSRFLATGLRPTAERRKDLETASALIDSGVIRTVIDCRYPLEETAEAHRYVAQGHKKGNVVITVVSDANPVNP